MWSVLDDNSDADYISETGLASSPDGVVRLSNVSDPVSSTGHIIRARLKDDLGFSSATVNLYQGDPNGAGTFIAALSSGTVTASFATYTYTLSAGEANAISDYNDLYFEIAGAAGKGNFVYCAWVELEVPDAGAASEGLIPTRKPLKRFDNDLILLLEARK